VIVAERESHYVYEVNWDGQVTWEFGVKGEVAADAFHLNNPWLAHPAKCDWGSSFDGVLISDYGNNRVVLVRKDDHSIVRETLSNGPEMAFQTQNLGVAVTGQIVGFVTDQDWNLRWYSPNNWRIVPTPTGSFILIDAVNLYELVPDLSHPPQILPGLYRLLTRYQLQADRSVGPIEAKADFRNFPPIPAFVFKNGFTIYIKSSSSARLDILTAKTQWSWAPTLWFDGWETYEEGVGLSPGKLYHRKIDDHHLFLGLKVTTGAEEGLLDAWIAWNG
jgi:hypothetical protein